MCMMCIMCDEVGSSLKKAGEGRVKVIQESGFYIFAERPEWSRLDKEHVLMIARAEVQQFFTRQLMCSQRPSHNLACAISMAEEMGIVSHTAFTLKGYGNIQELQKLESSKE